MRLPKEVTTKLRLHSGSVVKVSSEDKTIVIKPELYPTQTLEEMLSKVTKNNIHKETNWGKPMGKEI